MIGLLRKNERLKVFIIFVRQFDDYITEGGKALNVATEN